MSARRSVRPAAATASRLGVGKARVAPIRFGTSGWRGVLGEEVTFPRLRVLARAVAAWIGEEAHGRRVLIGWDARFASRAMAEMAASVLHAEGLVPTLSSEFCPTPAVTHALAQGRFAAGLVFTASHNPPADHGLKVFDRSGAPIGDRAARRIESLAARRPHDRAAPPRPRALRTVSLAEGYRADLAARLDRAALGRAGLTLHCDAMHGAATGYLDALMRELGVGVETLRAQTDPGFGGQAPDPIPERLGDLMARLGARPVGAPGLAFGIAHDGDGDRVAIVDGRGRLLSETQVLALLVDHLAATRRIARGVAIGAATGSLVERVARAHGLPLQRHPIGFKHLAAALVDGRADVAGDESGGFAWAAMGPDKDGILAGALLAERVAQTGEPLEVQLERLEARFGGSACGRIALIATPALVAGIERLALRTPARIDRSRVVAVDAVGGVRFTLDDGGFLMLRASGTEPLVRVYAEAPESGQLLRRLREGVQLARRAGR